MPQEPDPACRLIMDKDVTEMAFSAYGDEIRDRSFFGDDETVKGYWGDAPWRSSKRGKSVEVNLGCS